MQPLNTAVARYIVGDGGGGVAPKLHGTSSKFYQAVSGVEFKQAAGASCPERRMGAAGLHEKQKPGN
ncbi:hypothetical protein CVT25_002312 [Psilocybe cyanescens]|uniref:Uncharacterized protein n=1 Tax=Psilocybe cyanescens TaxID=93625 RepID=A0A409WKP3_PSICY|nr:hypothetical protein CVT25_002312 [Psilocybe cyanescens]